MCKLKFESQKISFKQINVLFSIKRTGFEFFKTSIKCTMYTIPKIEPLTFKRPIIENSEYLDTYLDVTPYHSTLRP